MPTSTISNTITDLNGGAVSDVVVIARLKPGPAFRVDTGTEIASQDSTVTNSTGAWSLALERNTNIDPDGTYYEIEEQIPDENGGLKTWTIQVGASDQTVFAALVDELPASAGPEFLTQASADARYQALGGLGSSSPANVSTTASAGVSSSAARADHVHDIAAGALDSTALFGSAVLPLAAFLSGQRPLFLQSAAPSTPTEGDRWYDTDDGREYVYNGSVWVCVSPVTAVVGTDQGTASDSYVDLTTSGPAVSLLTADKALVTLGTGAYNSIADRGNDMAFAISGATTVAANGGQCLHHRSVAASSTWQGSATIYVTGLTPGTNTFTAKYRRQGGSGTANFYSRYITVQGLLL